MRGRIRRILAGVVLVGLTACGVTEDEAVRLKEGQTLSVPGVPLEGCSTFGCLYEGQVCMEVFFEYGRSPAVCVFTDVCDRLECQTQKPGYKCTLFDGFPGQVKCIERED
ncbi:hypothetical protein [Cystobacter fuscus]|uniref:hypothetical protein n=1 Tax=Cystobacter fuscus TaxID=43 RepID=UPI0018DF9F23|nr:hypothetical protein [Cystobacter fuscus]